MAGSWTKFSKEVAAEDEDGAIDRVKSDLGSKHRVKRAYIRVKDVTPVPLDEVEDAVVRYKVEGKA